MTAPHRRWRVTLDVHADTFDDLVRELEMLTDTMALHPGAEGGRREIVCGAGTATITEDPSVTPESYQAAADAWLAERRAAARTGGIGATVTARSTPYEVQSTGGAS